MFHNTARHPDVTEMIRKGLIDSVSIGGKGTEVTKTENGQQVSEIKDLRIKELSLVGLGGVSNAKIRNIGG